MKKITIILLSLMLIPELCLASHTNELKKVIDEYQYFLTVEWNQKDTELLELKTSQFEENIDHLIESGLTLNDLPPEMQQSLRELNANELLNQVHYAKGSSWNGELLGPGIILGITAIALLALIRYAVRKNKAFDECVANHGGDEQSCIDR